MNLFISANKTYNIDLRKVKTPALLLNIIQQKTKIPSTHFYIIHKNKVIYSNGLSPTFKNKGLQLFENNDTIYVYPRIHGGTNISTGSMLVGLIISLIIQYIAYWIILYTLEIFLYHFQGIPAPEYKPDDPLLKKLKNTFYKWLGNYQLVEGLDLEPQLDELITNNYSSLLYIYLLVAFSVWFLYAASITQLFYASGVCEKNKPSSNALWWINGSFIFIVLLIPIIIFILKNWNRFPIISYFFNNYSVFILIMSYVIWMSSYYAYLSSNYSFSLRRYFYLAAIMIFFIFYVLVLNGFTVWKAFIILPMISGIYFAVAYMQDFYSNFGGNC